MEAKPIEIDSNTQNLVLASTPQSQHNDQNQQPTQTSEEEKKFVIDFSLTEEYIKEVTPILQKDKYTQSELLYSTNE
jgi:hypothetical protein